MGRIWSRAGWSQLETGVMGLSLREIDALEDIRVALLAKAQGPLGVVTAKGFANSLMGRACDEYAAGNLKEAIWLAEREFQFNCRVFGVEHPFTRTSLQCLSALKVCQRQIISVSILPVPYQQKGRSMSIA
jgi:hypothetical protein